MSKRSVFVVADNSEHYAVEKMFVDQGWSIADNIEESDLVQFVGGADVGPALYGHQMHRTTYINKSRDDHEMNVFFKALELGIPMAGICRGGQFLNVMCGGTMYQDVNGHAMHGTHKAWIKDAVLPVMVTSTHHQMMKVNQKVENIVLMSAGQSTRKVEMGPLQYESVKEIVHFPRLDEFTDVECVFYPENRCLCFQPHPEYGGSHVKETLEVYFNFLDTYIFSEAIERDVIVA